MSETPWSHAFPLRQLAGGPVRLRLEADEVQRRGVARLLGLVAIEDLTAELDLRPWLDGMIAQGRLKASVVQTCGVTLEPFPDRIETGIEVRFVPQGSPNAPAEDTELSLDPEADDPPDLLGAGDQVDLAALVIEHLSLALDPFPRKPDAVFTSPVESAEISPFAVLKSLKS